jgi:sigma-B regulation protein RsbU (phosphoserine phosphatase)
VLYEETLSQAIYKSELEIAARIQSRLLPQSLPTVKGLDIATYSRPARHVGGDLYGLVTQKDRPFLFMVGDVSGKGTSAAMMMSMARILLQSSARFLPNPSPEIVLDRTNQDLYQDCTELRMFLTAFVGSYHPEKNEITYANAGHSPVIFCPAGGPAVLLEADGPPVGVLNKFISELMHLPFEEGDVLVVATDGLNEASDPDGELFGYEGLYKLIEELSPLPAQAIVEGLMKAIDKFSAGHPQDDDQTLLVIKGVAQ